MELALNNCVAVVTGGASGIGAACVRAMAHEGMNISVLDRDSTNGRNVVSEITAFGGRAIFVETDVTDEISVAAAIKETVARLGNPDVLLTSAGVSGPVGRDVTQMSRAEWDQVFSVNVTGAFLAAKYCVPYLEKSSVGTMVCIGSDASFAAFSGMAPYCASKGAVLMFTKALSIDHPAIRVNCLCPSVVDTPMVHKDLGLDASGLQRAAFPVIPPEQLARHALFLASPVSAPINGTSLLVDFGFAGRTAFPTLDFAAP